MVINHIQVLGWSCKCRGRNLNSRIVRAAFCDQHVLPWFFSSEKNLKNDDWKTTFLLKMCPFSELLLSNFRAVSQVRISPNLFPSKNHDWKPNGWKFVKAEMIAKIISSHLWWENISQHDFCPGVKEEVAPNAHPQQEKQNRLAKNADVQNFTLPQN